MTSLDYILKVVLINRCKCSWTDHISMEFELNPLAGVLFFSHCALCACTRVLERTCVCVCVCECVCVCALVCYVAFNFNWLKVGFIGSVLSS